MWKIHVTAFKSTITKINDNRTCRKICEVFCKTSSAPVVIINTVCIPIISVNDFHITIRTVAPLFIMKTTTDINYE